MAIDAPQTDRSALRNRRILVAILAAGALLRLAVWIWFGNQPPRIDDEQDYNKLGANLVQYHEYGFQQGVPTSLRPPLYPLLVAGVYELFGIENWQAVRALQALISLATVWLIYRLGLAVFSPRAALWAAALFSFYPSLVAYDSLILTEVLFTFLFCAACLAIVSAFQKHSSMVWAMAGGITALAALTRSVMWLFPPVLSVLVLLVDTTTIAQRLLAAASFCLAFVVVITPWSIRNSRLQETFITIDVMGGRNLMMGNYEFTPLYRAWDAISVKGDHAWHSVLRQEKPDGKTKTQGQIDKLAMKSGLKYMVEHPLQTVQRCCIKFINFWQLDREIIAGAKEGFFGTLPKPAVIGLALVIVAGYVFTLFSSIFGIVLCPPADRRIHYFFLLLIAFICGLHTLTFGHSRYHLPLIPILSLYAGAAICSVKQIWQVRWSGKVAIASLVCLLLGLSWIWELAWADPHRYLDVARHQVDRTQLHLQTYLDLPVLI